MSHKTAGWTEQEQARLLRLHSGGKSQAQIAAALGRSENSIRNALYRAKVRAGREFTSPVAVSPAADVAVRIPEVTIPDQSDELRKARASAARRNKGNPGMANRSRLAAEMTVEKYLEDTVSAEELWQKVEEENARRIEREMRSREFRVAFPGSMVLLAFMSDLHIACSNTIDMRRMREDAELIRDTPNCYAFLGGDMVDNHIKHRSAVLAARSKPSDQWMHFEYLLEIMGPKIAVAVAGNHDLWTDQIAGTDVLGTLLQSHRFTAHAGYNKFEARIFATVGSQEYKIGLRHQYRMNSTFNATHTIKQWHRLGEFDFDIGVMGHTHEAALESYFYRGRQCWAAKPGSYQITSAYSSQFGFNDSVPTCPVFLLDGESRTIIGFHDIRHALRAANLLAG